MPIGCPAATAVTYRERPLVMLDPMGSNIKSPPTKTVVGLGLEI